MIPARLSDRAAVRFWLAVLLTGACTGLAAGALTKLLEVVQHAAWSGSGTNILQAAEHATASRHVLVLLGAGLITAAGQVILHRLSSGNGIDTTEAIAFQAGRMPPVRTSGSAVLSVLIVGMGASLGREGAPKQAGAVFANGFSDRQRLSDEERQLLVACGAGAGMAAAYGVPLGGALFALEVMRGKLALRYVLPALVTSVIATLISWTMLPNTPTYTISTTAKILPAVGWALIVGPFAGLLSVLYVRLVRWADAHRPRGRSRVVAPILVLTSIGVASIWFPQILGNGKDISQQVFYGAVETPLLLAVFGLKPLATLLCLRSGAPGGLFTPSLTLGALLGGVLQHVCSSCWAGTPPGILGVVAAGSVLAATTQGPISAVVLMMELTGHARSLVAPLLIASTVATLVARTIELRSIYDARLDDGQVAARHQL
ncbi:MAG TPA: chloride channel protein [Vicinamibacterales bacterium]|nr:chloride channel protein [Vicinamibacterales bacterium]